MKKLFFILFFAALTLGAAMAQEGRSVSESQVPTKNVKDFLNRFPNAGGVAWAKMDSVSYNVSFTDEDGTAAQVRYSPMGTENCYFVEPKFYPHVIVDTIKTLYPSHDIKYICLKEKQRNWSYEARISVRKGFLFWKKESDIHVIIFNLQGAITQDLKQE